MYACSATCRTRYDRGESWYVCMCACMRVCMYACSATCRTRYDRGESSCLSLPPRLYPPSPSPSPCVSYPHPHPRPHPHPLSPSQPHPLPPFRRAFAPMRPPRALEELMPEYARGHARGCARGCARGTSCGDCRSDRVPIGCRESIRLSIRRPRSDQIASYRLSESVSSRCGDRHSTSVVCTAAAHGSTCTAAEQPFGEAQRGMPDRGDRM